jgi:hypothetical protein
MWKSGTWKTGTWRTGTWFGEILTAVEKFLASSVLARLFSSALSRNVAVSASITRTASVSAASGRIAAQSAACQRQSGVTFQIELMR